MPMIVSMGFTPEALGKVLASATYSRATPWTWLSAFTTDVAASSPMRHEAI